MRSVAPSARLAPFVRDFMIVEVDDEVTRTRIPEPGLVLGVRYRGSASLLGRGADDAHRMPDAVVTGMQRSARRMRTSARGAIVLARFRPQGAAQFFARPLHELAGATLALDDLVPRRDVARVQARVHEAASDADRVRVVEAFLVARMLPEPPDPVVAAAVRAIEAARGQLSIRTLARQLAISVDPLEKRFRRAVGTSPKQLASLVRVRRAIDAYRPGTSLARLALDAGYYDQSHFHREFRATTGEAPGRFLGAGVHLR